MPHPVFEKDNGMFGTLSVYLPSKNEGGDVITTYKGEKATFKTAPCSAYDMANTVVYTDVIHEAQEVTSGYRVVVCYSLYHAPSAALLSAEYPWQQQVPLFEEWNQRATAAVREWFNWPRYAPQDCPAALLYILCLGYEEDWLRFNQLEGIDKTQVADLQKACDIAWMHMFLATVRKEVYEEMDYDD